MPSHVVARGPEAFDVGQMTVRLGDPSRPRQKPTPRRLSPWINIGAPWCKVRTDKPRAPDRSMTIGDMAMANDDLLEREFREHDKVARVTAAAVREPFERLVSLSTRSLRDGGKLLFFGNGGSAADAQHLVTELTVRLVEDRPPIAAIALTTDTSALTAIGNDFGFEHVFARQIEALGKAGDVAIGITTSGRSANIIRALRLGKEKGLTAAAFAGRDGGDLVGLADPLLIVPAQDTQRIQEMHILIGHTLCAALERALKLV